MFGPVIAIGAAISLTVAFEPHFSSAYRLHFDILVSNLLPYLIYVPIAYSLKSATTGALGLALLAAHLVLLNQQQWLSGIWPSVDTVYTAPWLLSLVLLTILAVTVKSEWMNTKS